ncbi:hypothetical protein [Kitasatospora sp. SUK 42]|uniref:hypothetical protein n=1 Tax=Kitasatospora sp. SUK 42 TaxID=1588882 RepID=UPI0018C962A6|nr:hypothetical protein [Kitasatospora sp. SUK 42]MBV2156636.1 hypothetical protein [Kitasatospora sp. SUK 42]
MTPPTLAPTPSGPPAAEGRAGGRRILLAPVTVSPTKPLTPTHLKYLLSLDLLHRATATFSEVTFLYRHATYAGSRQVAGFWDHLDRHHPDLAYEALGEEDIGELYSAYHRAERLPYAAIEPMVRRAEDGWTHPVSARLLDLWEGHYRLLGLFDPELGRTGPEPAPEAEVLDLLVRRDLCVRPAVPGAPVFLDATAAGLPLRVVVGADGQANYLLYLLRELVPLLDGHDLVVLAHDTELRTDYQTVAHVLRALGVEVRLFEVPRVAVNGVVQSTRAGGWRDHTMGALAGPLIEEFGPDAFRLGLRLYLVAGLGRTARESFSLRHLRRWARRASALLAAHGDGGQGRMTAAEVDAVGRHLAPLAGRRGYADPYQVATELMSRDPEVPVAELLGVVTGRTEAPRALRERVG